MITFSIGCVDNEESILNADDITKVDDIANLKHDMTLANGKM